jgi:hypothetical protein
MQYDGIHRGYRAVKLIGAASKIAVSKGVGRAGTIAAVRAISKVTIITAVADAMISVGEATCRYLELQKVREETRQLEIHIHAEQKRLRAENEKLKLFVQRESKTIEDNREKLESCTQILKTMSSFLKILADALERAREDVSTRNRSGESLKKYYLLESKYEKAVYRYYELIDQL